MFKSKVGFQFFADAGTLVNATGNYVNAGTGQTTAFSGNDTLAPTMKTFYDTQLLENARPNLVHAQLAGRQALPRNHGKTVEWRKWNTLKDAEELTEGVIPTGQKMGQTSTTGAIKQIGLYVTVSDQLELHALDNVILGATEELGASAGTSIDKRVRDAEADLDTLMHMTWLERLWISYNMYRDDQIEALKAALPDTQVQVIYTTDCVSQGWRNGSEEYFNMRDALHMYYIDDDSNHVYINPYTNQPSQYDDTDPFR